VVYGKRIETLTKNQIGIKMLLFSLCVGIIVGLTIYKVIQSRHFRSITRLGMKNPHIREVFKNEQNLLDFLKRK